MTRFFGRWGGYIVFVIVFAVACGLLSWWQWARRAEAVAAIELVAANWDRRALAPSELLPELDAWKGDLQWRPVELTGRYLIDDQLLARNRPNDGAPGFEVIVPLELDDGRIFLVDRGWIGLGSTTDVPDDIPAAPSGEVTVIARLKAGEPVLPGRTAPEGQLVSINLPTAAKMVGGDVYTGGYGLLDTETPAPATRPVTVERPEPDEGPHLSYALQWIAFGILAFIGLGWAIRHDRAVRRAEAAGEPLPQRRPGRRPSDADIEDALLDAHR